MNRFHFRSHGPSILVAALSSAFGVALLQITTNLAVLIRSNDGMQSSQAITIMLSALAIVFIVIAVYVGAVVTSNTFATIIAGRTRTIALLRLVGATAASQRRAVAREGLLVGVIGSLIGAAVGTLVTLGTIGIAVALGYIPALTYSWVEPVLALPIVAVVLTTWIASWVGSRRVLDVSPIQATGASHEASREEVASHRGRNVVAIILFALGFGLLVLAVLVGFVTPLAVLIGVVGGVLSFTGLVLGAQLVMPPALRLVGRVLGRGAAGRLAAENAVRYPERSSRTTIGLVIGVTLITMFAVAAASFERMLQGAADAGDAAQLLAIVTAIFSVLVGFSALIAAVGLVNNLSLSVLQRTRELGLLRALGFTSRQLRGMIRAESAQLTVAALLVGLVLGTFYGWVGAQSLLGSGGFVVPVVPLWLIAAVIVSAAVLTVIASVAPARRATRIAPVVALAVE